MVEGVNRGNAMFWGEMWWGSESTGYGGGMREQTHQSQGFGLLRRDRSVTETVDTII